jgi:hypothetical protein
VAKIFVSHSSADATLVESLKEHLTRWGYQSFFVAPDPVHGPMAGTLWQKELYRGLAGARLVLVLWGEHFRESAWCVAEIILADFLGSRIVPVITDATPLDALLKPYQAVDVRRGGTIDYDVLLQAITGLLDPAEDFAWDPRRSPFPGLESFGSGDAAVYFGREEELAAAHACLSRLLHRDSRRVLAIHGDSGTGKSSFLNAGLLPRLRNDPRRQWRVPPPINRYHAPLLKLARALATDSLLNPEVLLDCLETGSPDHAAARLVQLLDTVPGPDDYNGERLILLALDQAEALIPTMATEEAQRFQNIIQAVLNVPGSPLILAVVVQTEASAELSRHFLDLSSRSAEIVAIGPMLNAELPKVIEQPCSVAGIQMISGLTKRMVDDLQYSHTLPLDSHALPLLAYTLSEMYQRAADSDRRFTLELYEKVGGIRGSIERQLKFLEGGDVSEPERIALQSAFSHLVTVTDDGQPIRQSARWDVIPGGAHRLIKELIRRRLMRTFLLDVESQVELTHESLFELWPQLAQWVQENGQFLRWRRRFNAALNIWLDNNRAPDDLLRGRALTEAVDWQAQRSEELGEVQQEFIAASERRHDEEEERVRNLYRRAEGLRLAAQAELLATEKISGDPSVALILATESMKKQKSFEADRALRAALAVAAPIYWQLPKGRRAVTATASLRSGKLIAVGHADGCCRVFDPDGGNEIITVQHEPAPAAPAPMPPDGWRLGAKDQIIEYPVYGVAFTSDGKHLVSASEDGTCRMWDISSGDEVYRYARDSPLVSLAVGADSDWAVCGAKDGTVALLDLVERRVVWAGGVPETAVLQVALAPDSRYVALIGSDGLVMAISAEGAQQWRYEADFGCLALAISPDGALVAVTGDGTKGVLLDAASGSLVAQIDSVASQMKAAAWRII